MLYENEIELIVSSSHWDPFQVLGMHPLQLEGKDVVAVRAFLPDAKEVFVIDKRKEKKNKEYQMDKIHDDGLFEVIFEAEKETFLYQLKRTTHDDQSIITTDPYCFPPVLTEFDLHLIGEGTHYHNYKKLGSHVRELNGVIGTCFAVWAPNAQRVSVIGNFNNWDGRTHMMRVRGSSGIWELFIPDIKEGEVYKYEIKSKHEGQILVKADPYAFFSEVRPQTASVVYDLDHYTWNDDTWMKERANKDVLDSPITTYEVHLGSWRRVSDEDNRFLTYRELADTLVPYVKEMGYSYIQLLPVSEHPLDESWGYQTSGYYACTSRFGTPSDFRFFVDKCHQEGIGVIIDWVPAHFPKDAHGLGYFDGTALYEHQDPRKAEQKDWGTLIFNYGRSEVSNFLISNALFWLDMYHVDGLRVDAVASMLYLDYSRKEGEWVPNEYGGNENLEAVAFIKRFNEIVHQYHPGILTIAEESTAWAMVSRPTYIGGLGFSLKWNMGWMHDILEYFSADPLFRKYNHNNLTFTLLYAFNENFVLVLSHDEVVHGKRSMVNKMPGDLWNKFGNLRLLYGYMYCQPGKKLLFMGGEIGQWSEWDCTRSLDWHLLDEEPHKKLQNWVKDLNQFLKNEPALYEHDFSFDGFEWIDFNDYEHSVVSFIRKSKNPNDFLVCVFNFTPLPRYNYRVGVPKKAIYEEVLNSDSETYWGSNVGNTGGIEAEQMWWQGREYSLNLTLPPLGALILKPKKG